MKKTAMAVWAIGALALGACVPSLVVTGATGTGVVASQERSTGNAVDDAGIKLALDNLFVTNPSWKDLLKNIDTHVSEGRVVLLGSVEKRTPR